MTRMSTVVLILASVVLLGPLIWNVSTRNRQLLAPEQLTGTWSRTFVSNYGNPRCIRETFSADGTWEQAITGPGLERVFRDNGSYSLDRNSIKIHTQDDRRKVMSIVHWDKINKIEVHEGTMDYELVRE